MGYGGDPGTWTAGLWVTQDICSWAQKLPKPRPLLPLEMSFLLLSVDFSSLEIVDELLQTSGSCQLCGKEKEKNYCYLHDSRAGTNLSLSLSLFSSIPPFYLGAVGDLHIKILNPSQLEQTKPEWGGRWWRLRQCIFSHFDELWRREVDNLLKKGNGGLYVNVFRWIINVAF